MIMLLFLSSLLHLAPLPVEPKWFSFPTFNPASCSNEDLLCMGSVTSGNGYLNITTGTWPGADNNTTTVRNEVGRVLYPVPVLAWPAIISTSFTLRILADPNSTNSGDGMAFVMAQDKNPSPEHSYGAFLGLFDYSTQGGVLHQLGVEFDTYRNEFDPDDDHIGIDTTSLTNPVAAKSLKGIGIDLKSGRDINVKVDYDGWTELLQISVAYSGDPLTSFLNQSISLEATVPSVIYVGFTASTGTVAQTHQVLNWFFSSMPIPKHEFRMGRRKNDQMKTILLIVISIGSSIVLLAVCLFPVVRRSIAQNIKGQGNKNDIESLSRIAANAPKKFTHKELSKCTGKFSTENLLGTGGFGSVYKGILQDPPSTIAVKKISASSKQGEKEYLAEFCTIGRLRHKNILQLQGWCHEQEDLLLVYEYMPYGSLDRYIGKLNIDWGTRYKILTGLASALLYLHEECDNPVVQCDVKPNNVMLDSDFNAHLGDFGLARLLRNDLSVTTMLAGTPGYMAPEVCFTGRATPESDVYSFGMVVIELVCGKRSRGIMDESSIVDHVWELYENDALFECVDPMLIGKFDEVQVGRSLIVGLACLHPDSVRRPKIRKVVQVFMNPNEPLMDLQKTRHSAVYVSLQSSAASTPSNAGSSALGGFSLRSSTSFPDETIVQYGS